MLRRVFSIFLSCSKLASYSHYSSSLKILITLTAYEDIIVEVYGISYKRDFIYLWLTISWVFHFRRFNSMFFRLFCEKYTRVLF